MSTFTKSLPTGFFCLCVAISFTDVRCEETGAGDSLTWQQKSVEYARIMSRAKWTLVAALAEESDLIACGGAEVFVIEPAKPNLKKWSWRAEQSPRIPKDFHTRFRSTDDCKPYEGGLLLITSSSGGVTLIHRATKKCLFLAESKNAHSACLLPNGQIAVASSFGGDQLQFFDRNDPKRPASVVQEIPLHGAHGTVWDSQRKCLWALGEKELLSVVVNTEESPRERWTVKTRTPLPSVGGHDLSPHHDQSRLLVTTNTQVLIFDRDKFTFTVAEGFGDPKRIKSVDRHATSGRIVFHQATAEHWWSDTIRFTDGEQIRLMNERLYKIRWDTPLQTP